MRGLALGLGFAAFIFPICGKAQFDPIHVYGEQIAFDVLRNGSVVGEHVTSFQSQNDGFMVQSHMNLSIGFLFIPLYDFTYHSYENWRDDKLSRIRVSVDDGGKRLDFAGSRQNQIFKIRHSSGKYAVIGDVFSTNHWHPDVVKKNSRQVLNTLTGNMNVVSIEPNLPEDVTVKGGTVLATRYDYSGQLHDVSSWYDNEGRWVKLRFKARDGSTIEYLCRTCVPEKNQ